MRYGRRLKTKWPWACYSWGGTIWARLPLVQALQRQAVLPSWGASKALREADGACLEPIQTGL